jgi:hypothetical protein
MRLQWAYIQLDKFLLFLLKHTEEAREMEDSGLISKNSAGSISELLIIFVNLNRHVFWFVKRFVKRCQIVESNQTNPKLISNKPNRVFGLVCLVYEHP